MYKPAELIQRLKSGKLTPNDIKRIEKVLAEAEKDQAGKTIGGRPIVARLPHGMDIVK
jgi:hypothetical protein